MILRSNLFWHILVAETRSTLELAQLGIVKCGCRLLRTLVIMLVRRRRGLQKEEINPLDLNQPSNTITQHNYFCFTFHFRSTHQPSFCPLPSQRVFSLFTPLTFVFVASSFNAFFASLSLQFSCFHMHTLTLE
jgi:hypothetical protein